MLLWLTLFPRMVFCCLVLLIDSSWKLQLASPTWQFHNVSQHPLRHRHGLERTCISISFYYCSINLQYSGLKYSTGLRLSPLSTPSH